MATTTYAVHTLSCTYLLDEDGVCHRLLAPGGLVNDGMGLAVGAQFVACLDVNEPGLLVTELRLAAAALFARLDDEGQYMLLRTSPIESIEVKMPGVVLPTAPIVTTPMARPRPARGSRRSPTSPTDQGSPPATPSRSPASAAPPRPPTVPATPAMPAAAVRPASLRPPALPTLPPPASLPPPRSSLPPPVPSRPPPAAPLPAPAAAPAPPAPRSSQRSPAPRPGKAPRSLPPLNLLEDSLIEGLTALIVSRPLYQPTASAADPARTRAPAVPPPRTLLASPPAGGAPAGPGRAPGPPYIPPEPPRARRKK